MSNKVQDSQVALRCNDQLKDENIQMQSLDNDGLDDETEWIRTNFKKRSCVKFVYGDTEKEQNRCCCGYPSGGDHTKVSGVGERWREETCTAAAGPTDAFGEISFSGGKSAKYLRMDKYSNMDAVKSLLLEVWDIPYPNIIVSVMGEAKKLHLNHRLKKAFKHGLMDAVQSTGGWLITSGVSEGVSKLVGQAVRDYAQASSSKAIPCIGLAAWGCVANRNQLLRRGDQAIEYRHSYKLHQNTCNLDVNHSHFLLVDNGTHLKPGAEMHTRTRIEEALKVLRVESSREANSVPLVCVVMQGGFSVYESVKCAVEGGTPVVLVKGSEGAADLLSYAYEYSQLSKCVDFDADGEEVVRLERLLTRDQIVQLTERLRAEFSETQVPQLVDWIEAVLRFEHLITVYDIESDEQACDLDVAILQAVMKANNRKEDQLNLALIMNRDDIVKNYIFNSDVEWSTHDLEPFMYKALVLDRPKFVKIFLENNFMMHEFLSIEKLIFLYNTIYPDTRVKEFVWKVFMNKRDKGKRYFSLEDTGEVLESIAGRFYQSPYLHDARYVGLCPDTVIRPDELSPSYDSDTKEKLPILRNARARIRILDYKRFNCSTPEHNASLPHFDDPYNDLFTWSVLTGRISMAKLLWEEVSEPLAAALFAHLMWKNVAKGIKGKAREKDELIEASSAFEQLAIGLSQETSERDSVKSELLLIRVSEHFGRSTPLQLASYGRSLQFVGEEAPQSLLEDVWNGGLSVDNSPLKLFLYVLLTFIFPLYLLGVLLGTLFTEEAKQRRKSQMSWIDDDQDIDDIYIRKGNNRAARKLDSGLAKENISFVTAGSEMSWYQKLLTFHSAPRVIFMYNFLFYLIFLGLYAYTILTEFNPIIHPSEILLMIWIGSLVAEEIRQALFINRHTFREKLIEYVTDLWNIMDMAILIIFLLAIVLRVIPLQDTLNAGRILYSIDLMLFFFRMLYFFLVNKVLGPYIVMMGQIMMDLFYFLIVLLVLITGYAIAQQAILYPNSFKELGLIRDFYQRAYFQLFNQMSLPEMQGELACSFDEDLWSNNTLPRCPTPEGTWISPILLAVYLILANFLMLNLLIATFSSTYSRLRGRTTETWRFMRLNIVREYSEKPHLPPPFILFSLIYMIVRVICKRCWRCTDAKCGCAYSTRSPLQHRFTSAVDARLKSWESAHISSLLQRLHEKQEGQSDAMLTNCVQHMNQLGQQLQQLASRVEEISGKLNNGTGSAQQQKTPPPPPPPPPPSSSVPAAAAPPAARVPAELSSRIERLEAKFDNTSKSLGTVLAAVQQLKPAERSHPHHSRRSSGERPVERQGTQPSFSAGGGSGMQTRLSLSLTSPYPGTDVARKPLKESEMSWEVQLPDYSPPEVNVAVPAADPDDTSGLRFNELDSSTAADRRSRSGKYSVVNGRPQHPLGRTGLTGRGSLRRWGPNHVIELGITRWSRAEDGSVAKKRDRRILELMVLQLESGSYSLPQLQLPDGAEHTASVQQLLQSPNCPISFEEAKDAAAAAKKAGEAALKQLLAGGGEGGAQLVMQGCRDHASNTDAAWIEAAAYCLHDAEGTLWQVVRPKINASLGKMKWTELSHKSETKILASQWPAVEKMIQMHNAYY